MEFVAFHCNIFAKIFIAVHTSGKLRESIWLLDEVEFITLHCDVLAKILIAVHSSCEL